MIVQQLNSYLSQLDLPYDLSQITKSAYLVGGSVRDALLKRNKIPFDLDFVLPDRAIATAQQIANSCNAGFVVLDPARAIARVVFEGGTLDFATQMGQSLQSDLERRDFTINAIAFNWQTQELYDPLQGIEDLQKRTIRMVSPENLEADPLRLMRAYRQAAQLEFAIAADTRTAISQRAALITTIAAERVQAELNYLLLAPQGNQWLAAAAADGLLSHWLPSVNDHKIAQLKAVEKATAYCQTLGLEIPELALLAKLSSLVATETTIAETELTQLKYSRSQIKAVCKTVEHLPQLLSADRVLNLRAQYFWFLAARDVFPLIIVRAIASGVKTAMIEPLIARYLNPDDPIAYPQPLITGNDLIQELQLKPSPQIGMILTEVQVAQIESKISTRQQALNLASSLSK